MKQIIVNKKEYKLLENYKNRFDLSELEEKITDYFDDFDYILGDYSYDKLRLKGFCKKENKIFNKINDFDGYKEYLKNYCSFDCGYYILEKID